MDDLIDSWERNVPFRNQRPCNGRVDSLLYSVYWAGWDIHIIILQHARSTALLVNLMAHIAILQKWACKHFHRWCKGIERGIGCGVKSSTQMEITQIKQIIPSQHCHRLKRTICSFNEFRVLLCLIFCPIAILEAFLGHPSHILPLQENLCSQLHDW